MKIKLWKALPVALFSLGVAAMPLTIIACSSTEEPTAVDKNTYKPSPEIQSNFSKADFDVFCKGWELRPLENEVQKLPVELIGNKLTTPYIVAPESWGRNVEAKIVYTLAAQGLRETYADGELIDSYDMDLLYLAQNIKESYEYGFLANNFQPTAEIKAKFSSSDFLILSRGFQYEPIEPFLIHQPLKLINDRLTFPTLSASQQGNITTHTEANIVLKLSAPYHSEFWEGNVLKQTVPATLEEITNIIKKVYDFGVDPSVSKNYYKPLAEIEAKFSENDFSIFSRGWKLLADNYSLEKYSATLIDNRLSLKAIVNADDSDKQIISQTIYHLGSSSIKETYLDGIRKSSGDIDIETLKQELKLFYDYVSANSI